MTKKIKCIKAIETGLSRYDDVQVVDLGDVVQVKIPGLITWRSTWTQVFEDSSSEWIVNAIIKKKERDKNKEEVHEFLATLKEVWEVFPSTSLKSILMGVEVSERFQKEIMELLLK